LASYQPVQSGGKLAPRGVFITLEGIDGTGKSTHFRLLVKYLRARGYPVLATREPGGTRVGEEVRRLLLSPKTGPLAALTELTLIYAARAQHIEEVVRPALAQGKVVVSDRYNDASFAYQGYGRQMGVGVVRRLDRIVCGPIQPDLTVVLDLPARLALARARGREKRRNSRRGRFESCGLEFHERVRAGYLDLARKHARRVKLVCSERPVKDVQAEIRHLVVAFLDKRRQKPVH